MKYTNLICAYQGEQILDLLNEDKELRKLKSHEVRNLNKLCGVLRKCGLRFNDFDGYYIGYSIAQIGKEFDLLRFGEEEILNIELKSELKIANKQEKILFQMRKNFYYLKFLGKKVTIVTFVEKEGFYLYCEEEDSVRLISNVEASLIIKSHVVNFSIDPDKEFVPSNYLISPFNSTDKFINNEYFLTTAQQKIKEEILDSLLEEQFIYYCISANAGTGKTLLTYDVAKTMMRNGKKVSIIHGGKLNHGHQTLISVYDWRINPIRNISNRTIGLILSDCDIIFIDEAQRIRFEQLCAIIGFSVSRQIPIVFTYDPKQYLRENEDTDIFEFLTTYYPDVKKVSRKLTNKIRTNKEMASFIDNLLEMGKRTDHLNYDCVTVDYINNPEDLDSYIKYLKNDCGWSPITYTTSLREDDPYDKLDEIIDTNAHSVIGQEFSKVVLVMDSNFKYNDKGKLTARKGYYSPRGMLYQILTRAIDELKIIVYDNPELYKRVLKIKNLGTERS